MRTPSTAWILSICFLGAASAASVPAAVPQAGTQPAAAAKLPFLTKSESEFLTGEVSGDRAFEHDRWYTHYHRPFASEGLMAAAKYTEEQAKAMGLENVILTKTPVDGMEWTPKRGEFWATYTTKDGAESTEKLCDIGSVQLSLLDRSRPADVDAEVIDAGAGVADADYEGKDVKGKIVFAWGAPPIVMKEAVWKRGAAGLLLRPDPEKGFAHPDQTRWLSIPEKSEDGKPGTFAFNLSHRNGVAFAQKMKNNKIRARAVVEADMGPGWLVMVEATIPGTDPALPCVLYTGHLQEERFSANDDGSGCSNVLEVARSLAKGIREGKLTRPRRTLKFWWTTEIASEDKLFADHPEVIKTIYCNINQDMVGANQGQDTLRVQNITELPWSRAHYLQDVAEEVVQFLVDGNTSQLAGLQSGVPFYPFPVLSKLGTRHRYNARFVPYHANTDHQCFVAPPVGIPGFTFTNWPDDYIHSTDDDLWNIDPTQLQRNALAAATIGYAMAGFDDKDKDMLATLLDAHAIRRLGTARAIAIQMIGNAAPADKPEALRDALAHVSSATWRERLANESIPGNSPEKTQPTSIVAIALFDASSLTAKNMNNSKRALPTAEMDELLKLRPARVGSVKDYQTNLGKATVPAGLHRLLSHEILCLCDVSARHGKNLNGLDIYNIVAAEARSAGPWYYGNVTTGQVLEYLKSCAKAGLITLE
ncbi:MAG: M28 family peptidase [Planctomycetes bacterium]|nr:M28 family peptidase [Planctomycetota bacterium]